MPRKHRLREIQRFGAGCRILAFIECFRRELRLSERPPKSGGKPAFLTVIWFVHLGT